MNPNPRSATSFLMVPDTGVNLLSRTYCLALSRPVRAGPTASAPALGAFRFYPSDTELKPIRFPPPPAGEGMGERLPAGSHQQPQQSQDRRLLSEPVPAVRRPRPGLVRAPAPAGPDLLHHHAHLAHPLRGRRGSDR